MSNFNFMNNLHNASYEELSFLDFSNSNKEYQHFVGEVADEISDKYPRIEKRILEVDEYFILEEAKANLLLIAETLKHNEKKAVKDACEEVEKELKRIGIRCDKIENILSSVAKKRYINSLENELLSTPKNSNQLRPKSNQPNAVTIAAINEFKKLK